MTEGRLATIDTPDGPFTILEDDEGRVLSSGWTASVERATEVGHPRAIRFAGSVCARNAPALFVPCHRVRRSDGSLGGFAWGLAVKASLLAREGVLLEV